MSPSTDDAQQPAASALLQLDAATDGEPFDLVVDNPVPDHDPLSSAPDLGGR